MDDLTLFDRFVQSLEKDYENFDDKATLLKNLQERFRADFDSPPVAELSSILGDDVTDADARRIFFSPNDEDARHYVSALARGDSRLRNTALSLMFLKHRKKWDFLKVFVATGGLQQLGRLLVDPNLYARGQAMETFLSVTDCDAYDWFNADVSPVSTCLQCQLFSSGDGADSCLSSLFQNRAQSYPGGSFHALQIIAFWLSWVRARFSAAQRIQLHPHMFRELEAWATTESVDGGVSPELEESERQLARTLLDDFKREPPLEVAHPDAKGFDVGGLVAPSAFADRGAVEAAAMAELFPGLDAKARRAQTPEELKDAGNKHYKENNFLKAYELYTAALNALAGSSEELRASLLFNLASVHWKFYKSCEDAVLAQGDQPGSGGREACVCGDQYVHPEDEAGAVSSAGAALWEGRRVAHLAEAERLSRQVLALTGGHTKALYRLASCLLARDQGKEAYGLLDSVLNAMKDAPASEVEMLRGLMRQCIASVLVKSDSISSGKFSAKQGAAGGDAAESATDVNENDVISTELSCLKPEGGQPVLSKNTADILKKLRMRDRYEREGLDREERGDDLEGAKAKGKGAEQQHGQQKADALRQPPVEPLPSPPKAAAAKAAVKKPSAEDSAKLARKKLQQKQHKLLRSALTKNSSAALKSAVNELWENNLSLSDGIMESLDEESILKLIELALGLKDLDDLFGFKILRQLKACSRFESQLRFAVFGDVEMTDRIRDYITYLKQTMDNSQDGFAEIEIYLTIIQ